MTAENWICELVGFFVLERGVLQSLLASWSNIEHSSLGLKVMGSPEGSRELSETQIISILELREVGSTPQHHTAGVWQSSAWNLGLPKP